MNMNTIINKEIQQETLFIYKNRIILTLQARLEEILPIEIKNLQLFQAICKRLDTLMEFCYLFQITPDYFEIDMSLLNSSPNMNYSTGLIFSVKTFSLLIIFSFIFRKR